MELQNLKGTKDFLPEEQAVREMIRDTLVRKFQLYGFKPLETPILELFEILASKYAGGAEILKETYKLRDQGDREIGLRYDLTVPFSKVIGMNPNLKMPFKRYEIGKVFRDGPVKTARLREFTQCDVDVVGTESMLAEAEFIAMVFDVFKEFQLDVFVEFNNRKLLSGILEYAGVLPEQVGPAILAIDKLKKIGLDGVKAELIERGVDQTTFKKIFELLNIQGSNAQIMEQMGNYADKSPKIKEGLWELGELFNYLRSYGIENNITLLTSLARGLDIYTGTVFEAFLKKSEITSSICAGGRYDSIIGKFLGNEKKYPAVGITFGLDVIYEALKEKGAKNSVNCVKVYIIPIKTKEYCLKTIKKLRESGINSDIDLMDRSIRKNMEYANVENIPYAIIIGQDEINSGKLCLKEMKSGNEEKLSIEEIIKKLKN